ncbi:MAG: shikimate kinase, partial [Gemmiger formicilis]|nr:shikimate kinase [Gemmiger formicilis]
VYNPFRTELLLRAEEHHIPAASGFEMLVAQAVFAAEHFTGKALDADTLIPAVSRQLRHELANISIIGMPGCGKSTIGAALAKKLGKTFIDLDAEIERRTGHNIPDIFAQEGEDAFRRYETDVLAEVAKGNSQVIACGGGVIKSPANTRALRQNGPVLWVRRPLEALATGGRPLSKGGAALKQLEAERTPLYEAASTVVLENNGSLGEAVDAAVKLFETDEKL